MDGSFSMTKLLIRTVAHSTKPSFMPKTNNQTPKKFFSLALNWAKVVKMAKFWLSKSIFYVKKYLNISKKNFIEEYDFRGTLFVIDIFWKLQFFNHFIFLNDIQFLMTFTQMNARLRNFLRGWLSILGPKECLVECATCALKVRSY